MKSQMKSKTLAILCVSLLVSALCAARPASSQTNDQINNQWIGVWQGTFDDQPGVVLTIANDTGTIGGTLVLNIITRNESGESQIAFRDPHVLVSPQIKDGILSFEVKRKSPNTPADFTVTLLPSGNAQIHCSNCGSDAPAVEMTRLQ